MSGALLAVSAIVVNPKGQILLRRRAKDPDAGKWELIAGYVTPGERLAETLREKLRDKAGLTEIEEIEFTGHYYDDPNRHPGQSCIPLTFLVRVAEDVDTGGPGNELQWFTPSEIENLELALDNKQAIKDAGL